MPTSPSEWERSNAGKAMHAFDAARLNSPKTEQGQGRGSEMVKRSQPNLAEGPKPPGDLYHAVKRTSFDQSWREEARKAAREAKAKPKRVYEDFARSSNRGMSR